MLLTGMGLIIFGIGKIFIPRVFRIYRMWEMFGEKEEPGQLEQVLDRLTGIICLLVGISIVIKFYY